MKDYEILVSQGGEYEDYSLGPDIMFPLPSYLFHKFNSYINKS
jgi:hypothetical protein